jgi:hypothetical protein
MSTLNDILDLIEDRLTTLLPDYKIAPFVYNYELNERLAVKNYGIRVAGASSIPGTNKAVTLDQSVQIDLTQRYEPKKSFGDKDLRDKIGLISADIETLYKDLYRRPGSVPSAHLLLIAPIDLSEPNVDNNNNFVTITLTLSVKYRVQTL